MCIYIYVHMFGGSGHVGLAIPNKGCQVHGSVDKGPSFFQRTARGAAALAAEARAARARAVASKAHMRIILEWLQYGPLH